MEPEQSYWQRFWTKKVTRRRLVTRSLMAGAGLAAVATVGCGDDDGGGTTTATATAGATTPGATSTPSPTPATGLPPFGGEAVLHTQFQFGDFNPFRSPFAPSIGGLGCTLDTPLEFGPLDFELRGRLLDSWEIVGDGSEILFDINPDAKWHNQAPVNARAVDAEDMALNITRYAGKVDPSEVRLASNMFGLDTADVVGDQLRLNMSTPSLSVLNGLAYYQMTVHPREVIEAEEAFTDPSKFVGSGAFVLDKYDNGVEAIFSRNPEYWRKDSLGQQLPYLDSVRFKWLSDPAAEKAAFESGDVDYIQMLDQLVRDEILTARPDTQVTSYLAWGSAFNFRFNTAKAPFSDARVRKAIHLALDYEDVINPILGSNWAYSGALSAALPEAIPSSEISQMPGWNPATKAQDLEQARSLMSDAGFPDGGISFSIMVITTQQTDEMAVTIQSLLKGIWPAMDVNVEVVEVADLSSRLGAGDFDSVVQFAPRLPDAALDLFNNYSTGGSLNWGAYSNSALDALIDDSLTAIDADGRSSAILQAEETILEELPVIWLGTVDLAQGWDPKIVGVQQLLGPGSTSSIADSHYHSSRYGIEA